MHSIDLDELSIRKENLINLNTSNKAKFSPVMSQKSYRKVRPEPVNEKGLVGSVVNFIHDYVGADKQGLPSGNQTNNQNDSNASNEVKEQIEWLHFEPYALARTGSQFANSNIILVLGYKTGYSVWSIELDDTATEALSVRETNINHVKLIQCENEQKLLLAVCKYCVEEEEVARPAVSRDPDSILNYIDDETPLPNATSSISNTPSNEKKNSINFINLITGDCIKEIIYDGLIIDLKSNADFLCVNSFNRIDAFDLVRYEHRFSIETCYSQISNSTGILTNPFALGHRWIAFADNKFHHLFESLGGVSTDVEQSYTALVLNAAKSISKGLVKISESVVGSMVKNKNTSNSNQSTAAHSPRMSNNKKRHDSKEELRAGICTIIDTKNLSDSYHHGFNLHHEQQNWIVAHFLAHQEPIYALEFNPNGRLLVTADCIGQYFNVFQINPSPVKSTRTNVKHLYCLYRGDTGAKVRDISFSFDSRWLAINTKRGTTHIFPINIDGGVVNARTHSKPFVANKISKHQRTSGFLENEIFKTDDSDPNPSQLTNNPKLRSFLEPFVIPAYGQLKQPNTNSSFHSSVISSNSSTSLLDYMPTNTNFPSQTPGNIAISALQSAALVTENMSYLASSTSNMIQYDNVQAVSIFAESRRFLKNNYHSPVKQKPVSSLFVISDVNGNLVEYVLDVMIDSGKNTKPSNDSPIMLKLTPKAQWPLNRFISNDEVTCPIQNDNPLMKNLPTRSALSKQASYEIPNLTAITPACLFTQQSANCEWIKLIEVNTHIGPHRRLFMGPQFIFKTFNSSMSSCTINASSSSVLDNESGSIDISGDIELNNLDLSSRKFNSSTLPMNIRKSFDTTPTFIDIGAGSYQEGMPIMCGSSSSAGSVKSLNSNEFGGDKLIECLADAMSEMNPRAQNHGASSAIAISAKKGGDNLLTINPGSSLGSASTVGSYFLINQGIPTGHATVNTSLASCTSSSSAHSNGHNDSGSSAASSFSSNDPIIKQRSKNSPNYENAIFNDENMTQ